MNVIIFSDIKLLIINSYSFTMSTQYWLKLSGNLDLADFLITDKGNIMPQSAEVPLLGWNLNNNYVSLHEIIYFSFEKEQFWKMFINSFKNNYLIQVT